MNQQNSVLVVGGAGYIGSVNVAALIEKGKNVVVLDNFEKGHRDAVHPDATIEAADLRNAEKVMEVFKRHSIDSVMHFGAYSLVNESIHDPDGYFTNNFGGGHILLNAMRIHKIPRIVFSSTAAVYGNSDTIPIDEDSRKEPINAYGRSKLAFEYLLQSYEEAYGIHFAILRYFNAAGATGTLGEDHLPETHLIPIVLQVALGQREYISIYGTDYDTPDGSCIRDFIHVSDLADAHLLALEYIKNESIVCNLGNGHGNTVREVIETARKVTGHAIPCKEEPRRPGDPARLTASAKRAQSKLGWIPKHPKVKDIIESAWKWHQAHPNGYANL